MANCIIEERLERLRTEMKRCGIDTYIVSDRDPHMSEYPPERWKTRKWISGFSGSAGTAVITHGKAAVWSDSRYFIQAEAQLAGTEYHFFKEGLPATPDMYEWAACETEPTGTVAIDDKTISYTDGEKIKEMMAAKGIKTVFGFDPFDTIWDGRPAIPDGKAYEYPLQYSGEEFSDRRLRLLSEAEAKDADAVLLATLDDTAWSFNIRGCDIPYNPVTVAYGYISRRENVLFIDEAKTDATLQEYLNRNGITTMPYAAIEEYLQNLPEGEHVLADPDRTNHRLASILAGKGAAIFAASPATLMKSIKNDTENDGIRNAVRRDGAAMSQFLCWLDENIGKTPISETSASRKLHEFRALQPLFTDESFATIAGYAEHGAIVHYSATEESDKELKPEGFLLLDSGGQYLDGTTDITRTIPLGPLTDEERRNFTAVLKGHIAVATAVFPAGTRGAQIDTLAKTALWKLGLTYMHGTGHGIGHFLNVHEGPQNIRPDFNPTPLRAGMTISNEPGVYIEGSHGIRIENMILVKKRADTVFGEFYEFETLTRCPIDTRAIEVSQLDEAEKEWLNNYHAETYTQLAPLVDEKTRLWLAERCAPV